MRLLQNYDGTDLSNPQRSRGSLVCLCGNDIFATMGDAFGFTAIECVNCNEKTSILESTLMAEKLLNALGEDYCKVFSRIDNTILGGGIVMVDYLVFTEYQTKVTLSIDDRLQKIILAKEDAINKEWYERAARLRDEERIIECVLRQLEKYRRL